MVKGKIIPFLCGHSFFLQFDPFILGLLEIGLTNIFWLSKYKDLVMSRKSLSVVSAQFCKINFNVIDFKKLRLNGPNLKI